MRDNYYFPHDAEFMEDSRVIRLIEKYKMAGYGVLFSLQELLRRHENYRFHKSELLMHCRRINTNKVLVLAILNDFDLFSFDGEYYSSADMDRKMKQYDDKKCKFVLKKAILEQDKLLELKDKYASNEALIKGKEIKEIKGKEIEGKEMESCAIQAEEEKKDFDDGKTSFSDSNSYPHANPVSVKNGISDADSDSIADNSDDNPNNKNLVPDYEKLAQKKELHEMEVGVDRAFKDQYWVEIIGMNQQMPVEYIHHIPLMSRVFKDHIIQQGKVRAMSDTEEAKRYFANFARKGTATRTRLDERMRLELRKDVPFPYEDVDPHSGVRSVCGVVIPRDAPPRPDNRKCWDAAGKRWTD